jgi:hypothetical protein
MLTNSFFTFTLDGVGIAAHGEDAYMLGTATVTQNIGGGKWVDKWKATELNLCVSTVSDAISINVGYWLLSALFTRSLI